MISSGITYLKNSYQTRTKTKMILQVLKEKKKEHKEQQKIEKVQDFQKNLMVVN